MRNAPLKAACLIVLTLQGVLGNFQLDLSIDKHFSLHTRTFVLFRFLTPFPFFPSRFDARVTGCCLGATAGCLAQEVLLSMDNNGSVWVQYAQTRSLAST